MSESQSSKAPVEGGVDDLLLGDGFSIVDSTNSVKAEPDQEVDKSKETTPKEVEPTPSKKPEEDAKKEPEKTTKPVEVKKEPVEDVNKVNGHDAKSDALLITTEEDLEMTSTGDKEKKLDGDSSPPGKEATNDSDDKNNRKAVKSRSETRNDKNRKSGDVWVSNITRSVKATDLKKHFSKFGKVQTAKIVTNGRSFFGYILMENGDIANKCVRTLNSTLMEGRKIFVSRQRPDSQRVKNAGDKTAKTKPADKKVEKISKEPNKDEKKIAKVAIDTKKDETIRILRRSEDKLKRDNDFLRREVARLKRYIADEKRRTRLEENKSRTLGRELQEVETKLKEERRKLERERESHEKSSRSDRTRLEADRSLIKKELEEVKKLREYLKRKIDEEQTRSAERRTVRASSPFAYSSKRFRESATNEKAAKYGEERTRTPPSPPKLSRGKRSPERASFIPSSVEKERRSFHDLSDRGDGNFEKERHSHHGHGHGSSMVSLVAKPSVPAPPRNIWASSAFHQEVWRMPPSGSSASATAAFAASNQSFSRQSDYGSSSGAKAAGYSQTSSSRDSREFSKRDHYGSSSSSVRKY